MIHVLICWVWYPQTKGCKLAAISSCICWCSKPCNFSKTWQIGAICMEFCSDFFYSWSSLSSTIPTFSDLSHFGSSFDIPSTSSNVVWETNMVRSTDQTLPVRTNKHMEEKHIITSFSWFKEWMLLLQFQRCWNNIIFCFKLYNSCIKKMINPDGGR